MNSHIEDLRRKLSEHNWVISEELEGNELDISGYWVINQLYEPNKSLTLGFEGMDDLKVLPMEPSPCSCRRLVSFKRWFDLYLQDS